MDANEANRVLPHACLCLHVSTHRHMPAPTPLRSLTWACGPRCPPEENREGAWLRLPGLLFLFLFHLEAGASDSSSQTPSRQPCSAPCIS